MKVDNKRNLLQTFVQQLKITALISTIVLGGTTLQAKLPNVSYDLQACRNTSDNGYEMKMIPGPEGPVETYICNDKGYVQGNLFQWAELDRVPHRIIISTGAGEGTVDFNFTVSGDFQTEDPADPASDTLKFGWINITTLVLDSDLSDPACFDLEQASTQDLLLKIPGAQGAWSTIYRIINVEGMPANTTCVALWDATLAIGSSRYTGSSLQSYLLNADLESGDPGKDTVSLPASATHVMSKTMDATQDMSHLWSVGKTSPDKSVDFGDTCDENNPKFRDVTIKVSWVKEPATADGNVSVTTSIYATNTASRILYADLNDTIYDGDNFIHLEQFGEVELPIGTHKIGTYSFEVEDTGNLQLRDEAVMTYIIDQSFGSNLTQTVEASASVQPSGTTRNVEATIKDHEWLDIVLGDIKYAAWDNADIGTFDFPYSEGDPTNGDVNWTSGIQDSSGFVIFDKRITLAEATITSGNYLRDKATLGTVDSYTASSNTLEIPISSTATVSLTINKTIPDILQGDERVDFNFTVSGNSQSQDVIISFTAGMEQNSTTLTGLYPAEYTVTENPTPGFNPQKNPITVDLRLPTCSGSADFVNDLSGTPKIKVAKVTKPESIDSVPQDGDWNMTLYRQNTDESWTAVSSLLTDANNNTDEFVIDGILPEGVYKIREVMKAGWFEVVGERAGECDFTINYPADHNRSDIVCTYSNAKYAKIIIEKTTDPEGSDVAFSFTQDINTSDTLVLKDTESKTYDKLKAKTYTVTEDDPAPEFDLKTLECVETNTPDINTPTTTNGRTATINLDWGETVSCTFTNLERGMVEVIKYENGITPPSSLWKFTLTGEGLTPTVVEDNTTSDPINFAGAKLIPGKTYTLCEIGVPPTWVTTWDVDGVPTDAYNPAMPTYVKLLEVSNESLCIDFNATSAHTVQITVNNNAPEGDPRTIGYWKNWNKCSRGGQAQTAKENGGWEAGFWILNDVLAQIVPFGLIEELSCRDAKRILNKREIVNNKKHAKDAAYGMGAQLLAARANYAAGAEQCTLASKYISKGNQLLIDIEFDATGVYLTPKQARKDGTKDIRKRANWIARKLDLYNNGYLCP